MNVATIKYCDIANGPGVRTSLFVSGCRHCCPGCFNSEAWSFSAGKPFDEAAQQEVLQSLRPYYVKGLSLLGGEPLEPENQQALLPFLRRVREELPDKSIWCYSGFTLEQLTAGDSRCRCACTEELLSLVDVLVDGPFIEAEHDISLRFRGSRNQRLLDLPASLAAHAPVEWRDEKIYTSHSIPRDRRARIVE